MSDLNELITELRSAVPNRSAHKELMQEAANKLESMATSITSLNLQIEVLNQTVRSATTFAIRINNMLDALDKNTLAEKGHGAQG